MRVEGEGVGFRIAPRTERERTNGWLVGCNQDLEFQVGVKGTGLRV